MTSRKTLFSLLILVCLIFVLHLGGTYFQLYWRFALYDRMVHLLAAIWISIISLALLQKAGITFSKKSNLLIVGVCSTLIVGFLWEFFEYSIGQTSVIDEEFFGDTMGDIILDAIGGLVGSFYGLKQFLVWNNQNQQ